MSGDPLWPGRRFGGGSGDGGSFVAPVPETTTAELPVVSGPVDVPDAVSDAEPVSTEPAKKPRQLGSRIIAVVASLSMAVAVMVLGAVTLVPREVERVYGESKTAVDSMLAKDREREISEQLRAVTAADGTVDVSVLTKDQQEKMRQDVQAGYPTVRLGASGDRAELDRCDWTFTIMDSYGRSSNDPNQRVPVTAAAHNGCGGDVLLGWNNGQRVNITGEGWDGLYEMVDVRVTGKTWSTTDDLLGLGGDLALQSCFYGLEQMKFVGLKRVVGL